jgi:hypothetical protein
MAANVPFKTGGFKGVAKDLAISEEDILIQNMSLSELRKRIA